MLEGLSIPVRKLVKEIHLQPTCSFHSNHPLHSYMDDYLMSLSLSFLMNMLEIEIPPSQILRRNKIDNRVFLRQDKHTQGWSHIYFTSDLYLGLGVKIPRSNTQSNFIILNGIVEMVAKSYYFYYSQVITQEAWRLKSSHGPRGSICVSGKLRKGKEAVRISMKPFLIATLSDGERILILIYCLNALLKCANV